MPSFWLMKSEPDTYSVQDLERDGRTMWDGVRNYQARNNMRKMKIGDRVLFYHSRQDPPAAVGIAEVVKEAYPDPTQFDPKSKYFDAKSNDEDPRWWLVEISHVETFSGPVTLQDIKAEPSLAGMVLVNNSRLSVQPVGREEFELIQRMAGR